MTIFAATANSYASTLASHGTSLYHTNATQTQSGTVTFGQTLSQADKIAAAATAAKKDFLKYAHETPAQRIRTQYLKSHGLTEESLAELPAAIRQEIEREIKKEIERQLHLQASGVDNVINAATSS